MSNPIGVAVTGLGNIYDYTVKGDNKFPVFPKSPLDLLKFGTRQAVEATQPPKPAAKPTPETPTVSTRDVQKADGSKGTQTSPGGGMPVLDAATANKFLSNYGISGFTSTQLPGNITNPNSGLKVDAIPFGGQETSVTSNTLGAYNNGGVNVAALDNTGISVEDAFTNPEIGKALASSYPQYGGLAAGGGAFAQQAQQPTASPIKSGRLADALNDTAGMQSYMSKFGSPEQDRRRAADMAFLNYEGKGGILGALRAKESVLGQFHAGGQTYQLNDDRSEFIKDKDGNKIRIDPEAASSYRLGTSSADQYLNSYKGQMQTAEPTATPKQAENPLAQNPAAVTERPTNMQLGPVIDDDAYARNVESLQGMKGIGPVISGQAYGSILEGNREPLMRDPRNK